MNYSSFNSTYCNTNKKVPQTSMYDDINKSYQDKTNSFNGSAYPFYDEDRNINKKLDNDDNDNAITATKGIFDEENLDPVTKLFFSNDNVKRIQRHIKEEISRRTHGKYKLSEDQDASDLLVSMRSVLFDANNGAKYLPFKIVKQVKKLNRAVVQYVVPDMVENIKQYYGYISDIEKPLTPMLRPMNVSSAGRKLLSSPMSTIFNCKN